eukprot:gnl/TRDRNA2_/TRDRNA2_199482_c0_seq1.p1 gnl/TRDRNA2_/TRDRNA2_199482_c0~~gnl/TRDRNA2_/TRDRNA2_199482_c0_seq1.p1  ORF type:complete len:240 (-),score=17.96 gnl/TRDRNA2_/TRDRNA2_199482_c0_seq1:51-770(-)
MVSISKQWRSCLRCALAARKLPWRGDAVLEPRQAFSSCARLTRAWLLPVMCPGISSAWPAHDSLLRCSVDSVATRTVVTTGAARANMQDKEPTTSPTDQLAAAELRAQADAAAAAGATASREELDSLRSVQIDDGTFKYVLLRVWAKTGESRHVVCGTAGAKYHKDVAGPRVQDLMAAGFGVRVLGGGRMRHEPERQRIEIYGFSFGFPWVSGAGHHISAEECRRKFTEYEITFSDDGY